MNIFNLLALSKFMDKMAENANFIIIGFVIVCLVLLAISGIMKFIGLFFVEKKSSPVSSSNTISPQQEEQRRIKAVVEAARVVVTDQLIADTTDPKLVAVISAAVSHMLKNKNYVIRQISVAPQTSSNWNLSGRQAILSSHKYKLNSK